MWRILSVRHDSLTEVSTMTVQSTLLDLLAQWQPGPHGPGPHGPHWGGGGHHWGGGLAGPGMGPGFGMGGGWLLVLLLTLLLVGVAAALYLTIREGDDGAADALAVLRERYAAGDLDEEEFERRRERLTG
jgi:putative membrane protein